MKKFIKKTLMVGVAALGLAGLGQSAQAAMTCDCKINLFGASAQYKFWTAAAPQFLIDEGCAAGDITTVSGSKLGNPEREAGIAICRGPNWTGSDGSGAGIGSKTVCVTYTTFNSRNGVLAALEQDPDDAENGACGTSNPEQRMVPDESTVDGTLGLMCQDVHVGVSDVKASTFRQSSSGLLYGPDISNGSVSDRFRATAVTIPSGYEEDGSVAVPFAFFVNASPDGAVPFTNITQSMAAVLFSGKIENWNEFKPDLDGDGIPFEAADYNGTPSGGDNLPVVLCLRHAGSGTHATLDAAVLSHTPEDGSLKKKEVLPGAGLPVTFFNKESSNVMYCVGGNLSTTVTNYTPQGAIGYADADKESVIANGTNPSINGKYGDVRRLTYNGEEPTSEHVALGMYNFYSENQMYYKSTEAGLGSCPLNFFTNFVDYSDNPCNLPGRTCGPDMYYPSSDDSCTPGAKCEFWATQSELRGSKTDDYSWPTINSTPIYQMYPVQ